MSLKKAEKPQDVLYIKVASINTESQKTPAECRVITMQSVSLQRQALNRQILHRRNK